MPPNKPKMNIEFIMSNILTAIKPASVLKLAYISIFSQFEEDLIRAEKSTYNEIGKAPSAKNGNE